MTLKYVQHVDYTHGEFSLRFSIRLTPQYKPINLQSNKIEKEAKEFTELATFTDSVKK